MLAGLLLAVISPAAAQEEPAARAAQAATSGFEVDIANGRLTLYADGAPLADVLRAIGEAGSFEVVLRGSFAMPVRESFADQPLEQAIRLLVERHSLVISRGASDPAPDASTLTAIRVIENPALTGSDDVTAADPAQSAAQPAQDDATSNPPLDREAFRRAKLRVPPPTKDDLLFELDDPDQAARTAAVAKVGVLPPREAITVISHVFANEEDTSVRSRAVAALTRLGGAEPRILLRTRALRDDDPGLRMQALNALASSRAERVVNILAQALRQDPEPKVRMSAVRALGRVGGGWARRHLQRAARDLDPEIRLAAEQALAGLPARQD